MGDVLELKKEECYEQYKINGNFSLEEKFCPLIFDGIMCWTATKAGTIAEQPCPDYLVNSKEYATKECTDTGQWFVNEETNVKWTNYSQCWKIVDKETALIDLDTDFENATLYHTWFPIIKNVSQWGYGISLMALITAMVIFLGIKKLRCARNRLHMHLFISFIMRGFMSLLKDFLFVEGLAMKSDIVFSDGKLMYIKEHYNWLCKALISSRNYFIIANYMLILMEGIYLHNLMFRTLFSDNSQITIYFIVGWGLPVLFIIPWVTIRIYYEDTLCWTTTKNYYYTLLIEIPIALSVIINFILFVTIVRILLLKLNKTYIQHRKVKYRRLTRSTLTLVPLFGVPYTISLIMAYTTNSISKTMELIWIFCDQTFTAFQGFFVALVYCLLNTEVHMEIKQKYDSLRDRQEHIRESRERTISHTQMFPTVVIPMQDTVNRGVENVCNGETTIF